MSDNAAVQMVRAFVERGLATPNWSVEFDAETRELPPVDGARRVALTGARSMLIRWEEAKDA